MSYQLSTRALLKSQGNNISQQIILEIDGIDLVFAAVDVARLIRFGDNIVFGQPGLFFGGTIVDPRSKPYISLQKSSKNLTQQLLQDKGGTGSVGSVKIELIDKNGEITRLFRPGAQVQDVLSRKASVYLSFEGGTHPADSIKIFNGIIDDLSFGAGSVVVNVAHPDQLKRQEVFVKHQSILVEAIDDTQNEIELESTEGLLPPVEGLFETYIRIEDELIKYAGITDNKLIGCARGQLGTVAVAHDEETETESFYELSGMPVETALRIMLSGPSEYFATNQRVIAFNQISGSETVQNAIVFDDLNIQEKWGLVAGDLVTIDGLGSEYELMEIVSFGVTDSSSYIVVNKELGEPGAEMYASFRSQFNILPDGCDMGPDQVDVPEHLRLLDLFGSSFPEYRFYLKDTITAKQFIEEQVYFPAGLYQLPRKGKASVGITIPPIAEEGTKVLNMDNVLNAESLSISRSTNSNFYNAVVYKFNESAIDDKFFAGSITHSANSANRIKIGNRPLTIEAKGLRKSEQSDSFIRLQSRRFLDRYQFAAEKISVDVNYKTGFNLEVGDSVIFGDPGLKISDMTTGNRNFQPRIMEIINKSLNFQNGKIRLDLLDTAFELDGRYGVIAPSSIVGNGSTSSKIRITRSFGTRPTQPEKDKWGSYIGQKILIYAPDWSKSAETVLQGFDLIDPDNMNVSPALPFIPQAGYLISGPDYPESEDPLENAFWKKVHCFFCPQIAITEGVSSTQFKVDPDDAPAFKEGAIVIIHDETYSISSTEARITKVEGDTMTVDTDLGFAPDNTMLIDLIGFPDKGLPYRII